MDEFPANGVIIIVLVFLLLTLNEGNTFFWCFFIANFDHVLRIGLYLETILTLKFHWHLSCLFT